MRGNPDKVVRQFKAKSVQLMLQPLGNRDVIKLVIYSDVSLGIYQMVEPKVAMLSFSLERTVEFSLYVGSQRKSRELPKAH